MSKTVTSLYHNQQNAAGVVSRLEQAGISRGDINVYSGAADDFIDDLRDLGVPQSDAHAYAEGVRRGGSLVVVECDDDEVDHVVSIVDGEGALDLEEEQTSWRGDGWQGYQGATTSGLATGATGIDQGLAGSSGTPQTSVGAGDDVTGSPDVTPARTDLSRTGADSIEASGRDDVIPIAEEQLHVGKREVSHGRVRIQTRVVERPVNEQVTLREETVAVERRPVSGEYREGSLSGNPFQERTIEVEERREEAVVSKEARVKEELVIRKDVEERTETVSDTVRRTEVDVEDERNVPGAGTTGSTDRKR